MNTFQVLLIVALSAVAMGQMRSAARAPSHGNPSWFIEQPDPFEAPEAYEAPEIPDALLYAAARNEPGAYQAINNFRQAHRAAHSAHVNNFNSQFGLQPRAPAPVGPAPVPARTAPTAARRAPAPAVNAQPSLHLFVERPDPFEAPEAYEAPEIPDAMLYAAARNEPGAYQAMQNYRLAHRAAYDAHLNSYRPPQVPRSFAPAPVARPAPAPVVSPAPAPTRTVAKPPSSAAPVKPAPARRV